ncbi:MAG: hypothetical protein LBQ47_00805 [Endomicrobium sp.]|jgi:hypothetical protein|nr:hypothetical protein [Endomicrobium sp.]
MCIWDNDTIKKFDISKLNKDKKADTWGFSESSDKKFAVYFYDWLEAGMCRYFASFAIFEKEENNVNMLLNSNDIPASCWAYDFNYIKSLLWADNNRYICITITTGYAGEKKKEISGIIFEAVFLTDLLTKTFSLVPIYKASSYKIYTIDEKLRIESFDGRNSFISNKEKALSELKWVSILKIKEANELFFNGFFGEIKQ